MFFVCYEDIINFSGIRISVNTSKTYVNFQMKWYVTHEQVRQKLRLSWELRLCRVKTSSVMKYSNSLLESFPRV